MATASETFELAVWHHQQGALHEAERLYRRVLAAEPEHAGACANLGVALQALGRGNEALTYFRQAVRLNPLQADAHNNLGNALQDQDELREAAACFRQALLLNSHHSYAHNNLGNTLKRQGRLSEAIACYRQALLAAPDYANAYYNLANALKEVGPLDEARACYQEALRLAPHNAEIHNNLGVLCKDQGRLSEAVACYQEALRLAPGHANALNNLGVALRDQGQLQEAATCFRQALDVNPVAAEVHNNLGVTFMRLGRFDEAQEEYEQALRVEPARGRTLWNRSVLRLLTGDLVGGWPDYERRWQHTELVPRSFSQPRWDGAPLEGKTILVHAEQGLGDTIQFVRYLPLVQSRGGRVVLECQPRLARLLANVPGVDLLVAAGAALPAFDVHVPLLSLPGVFATSLETILAPIPYLRAESALVEHWRRELSPIGGVKVGIAWQGNPKNDNDRYRSCPLTLFETLAQIEGVRLVSLQKGAGVDQLGSPIRGESIIDLGERLDREAAFIDTAAVLMHLDLVVTVDSAVAHLAGALGAPVWVVLPTVPDWRWLLERNDSPWYPTMRLFRQRQLGQWHEVFEEVQRGLREMTR